MPVVLPMVRSFLILLSQALPNLLSQDLQMEAVGHQAIPFSNLPMDAGPASHVAA